MAKHCETIHVQVIPNLSNLQGIPITEQWGKEP